ncbi:hypothetical protein Hanom_Chr11g01006691 [Helianthus anomalus]
MRWVYIVEDRERIHNASSNSLFLFSLIFSESSNLQRFPDHLLRFLDHLQVFSRTFGRSSSISSVLYMMTKEEVIPVEEGTGSVPVLKWDQGLFE